MNAARWGAAAAAAALAAGTLIAGDAGACPAVVAHRGESSLAPEETLPAIVAALKGGARTVEFDVRFTRSGTAVAMHDPTVDRTTNGTGAVSGLWTYQLRALDAGSWFAGAYTGERVPTLGEVLRTIRATPGATAYPEVKAPATDAQVAAVAQALTDNAMTTRAAVHSSDAGVLARFHKLAPTVPLGLVTAGSSSDPVGQALDAGAQVWNPSAGTVTAERVEQAHAAGLDVWVWTVDDPDEWARLAGLEVDGILTNRPTTLAGWSLARCGGQ